MAANKSSKKKNKTNQSSEGVETMAPDAQLDEVTEDVKDVESTEEASEDNTQAPETAEAEDFVPVPVDDIFSEYPDVKGDDELIELRNLMKNYIDAVRDPNSPNHTQKNTMLFVKMCKLVVRKDKVKLINYLYEGLIKGHAGDLISPQTVFMFMNQINDGDKAKVETLYTSLMALDNYLKRPKGFGFPLNLEVIKKIYGGDALSNFIKKYIP